MNMNGLHSREALAGYDRDRLEHGVVLLAGAGAAGNNVAQSLALSGLGELRVVDPDVIEPSNLTRSPLFRRERVGSKTRFKAQELAAGFLANSYAEAPIVRSASAPIQALALGAFDGVQVIVAAVDSFPVRAWLSDAARHRGIPLIEVGFSAPRGHVTVFPNRTAEEPCWRCLNPKIEGVGISCSLYARRAAESGKVAATQTVAAVFGALVTEAVIQALHGRFDLGGSLLDLDIRSGRSITMEISLDPCCPGLHRRPPTPFRLAVDADAQVEALLQAAQQLVAEPLLHLSEPLLVQAPCGQCGASVQVGKPAWTLTEAPRCRVCAKVPQLARAQLTTQSTVKRGDALASRTCRALGLPPGAIVEVECLKTGESILVQLAGGPDELFTTRRRSTPATLPQAPATPSEQLASEVAPDPTKPADSE